MLMVKTLGGGTIVVLPKSCLKNFNLDLVSYLSLLPGQISVGCRGNGFIHPSTHPPSDTMGARSPMQGAFKRIITGALFFLFTLFVAVVGYMGFGWELMDAVYMVVITIFGVGYGEVQPIESPAQKIFTMIVIFAGTTSAVYIVGGFIQMVTEGEINKALNAKLKERSIASLEQHVIVCGFSPMGQILAQQLHDNHEPFVVIDPQAEQIIETFHYLAREGSPTDEVFLETVGVHRARALVTVMPDDATNVFITLTARELNPDLVILARGERPSTEKKLRLAGADHIVLPDTISGLRMAHLLTRPTAIDFLGQPEERSYLNDLLSQIDVQLDELMIPAQSALAGKTVRELEVRGKGAFIVVAIRLATGQLIVRPSPSQILNGRDGLVVLGHRIDIPKFAKRYGLPNTPVADRSFVEGQLAQPGGSSLGNGLAQGPLGRGVSENNLLPSSSRYQGAKG
ncbi:MAG: potassium channel protein [Leptolyngbyaceae bacterium]|nr:potassium channel protein [Leptolyngbyaceae bacterium]